MLDRKPGLRMCVLPAWLLLALLAGPGLARDLITPAELPPPDFRGQQYQDSRGCLFVRAGEGSQTVWIPRVSRQGAAICGERAKRPTADSDAGVIPGGQDVTAPEPVGVGSHYVAVGSFGRAANADKAAARVEAAGYPVARRPAQGKLGPLTVILAGPFGSAVAAAEAREVLRAAGFGDALLVGP